jgi:hypothetical protein
MVPSAPYHPEGELLLLELLLLPAVPMKPGSRDCAMSREFIPPILPVCLHLFHQSCIITWIRHTTTSCCLSCHASITTPGSNKPEGVSKSFGINQWLILWPSLECSLGVVWVSFQKLIVSLQQKSDETSSVSCDAGLRPLPWSSFNMVERNSVTLETPMVCNNSTNSQVCAC